MENQIPTPNEEFSVLLRSVLIGWSPVLQETFKEQLLQYAKDCWIAGYDNGQYSRDLVPYKTP